ncbi:MAG: hypothetical protein HUN04_13290 [Desulfobacter sp.]|nr:MAG: hypothetical protein HUN04_13290 [Desulfobacter sp.]
MGIHWKIKLLSVWAIIIIGELAGFFLIIAGLKRKSLGGPVFKVKHLFQRHPVKEHSGMQLILEGVGVMLSGLLLYYTFFIWS